MMQYFKATKGAAPRIAAAMGAAAILSSCAADKLEHPSYWWDAKVLAVSTVSALAPEIDRSCLPATADTNRRDDRLVLVVRYRIAKALTTKAYLETRGENWAVGEIAYVHPDTCRIKRDFSPAL